MIGADVTTFPDQSLELVLTGDDKVPFYPTDPMTSYCLNGVTCLALSLHPVFVAGGQLDVRAWGANDACSTHAPLLDTIRTDLVPDPTAFEFTASTDPTSTF